MPPPILCVVQNLERVKTRQSGPAAETSIKAKYFAKQNVKRWLNVNVSVRNQISSAACSTIIWPSWLNAMGTEVICMHQL